MSNFVLIGATDACGGILPLIKVVFNLLKIFWIIIPIGLIVFGTIDLGKAVIASDEKEVKSAQSRLIKRFIYAGLVFFIPMLVGALMSLVATGNQGDSESWTGCWNAATK